MRGLSLIPAPLRRALHGRDGTAAIEFALIAAPLVFFLFAIIEIGLIFIANINLANATLSLARQIRTGGIVAPGSATNTSSGITLSLSDFKAAICNRMQIVPTATCLAQLQVDIRTQTSFANQTTPNPLSGTNFNSGGLCYYSGSGGSIVQFRAFFLWQIYTPLILTALANASTYTVGGTSTTGKFFVLVSSEAFKIEKNSAGSNNGSGC